MPCAQVHIPILNVPHRGSPATAVQQEIDNYPIPIFRERTVCIRLLEQQRQFFIRIGFLYRFLILHVRDCQIGTPFLLTPVQKGSEDTNISGNGIVGKSRRPHCTNHILQVPFGKRTHIHFNVKVFGDVMQMLMVIADGNIRNAFRSFGENEVRYTSATDCPLCPFIVIFLPIIRPHPFLKKWQEGMRSNCFRRIGGFELLPADFLQ